MEAIRADTKVDRLTKRRDQVVMTLRYLDKEQKEVAQNTDWLDQAAHERRVALLDGLNRWYWAEMKHIDKSLGRIKKQEYRICLDATIPSMPNAWKRHSTPNTAAYAQNSERALSSARPSQGL